MHIVNATSAYDLWFLQRIDALERLGLSTLQEFTAAIWMLAYGLLKDACDKYYRMDESTALECLKRFVAAIHRCFESIYLRQPI